MGSPYFHGRKEMDNCWGLISTYLFQLVLKGPALVFLHHRSGVFRVAFPKKHTKNHLPTCQRISSLLRYLFKLVVGWFDFCEMHLLASTPHPSRMPDVSHQQDDITYFSREFRTKPSLCHHWHPGKVRLHQIFQLEISTVEMSGPSHVVK